MLTEYEKFRFLDKANKNTFFAEVNWEPENELINKCQLFKFTFPDGKVSFVERKHLLEMLFACGRPEDQRNMIPQTLETIHHYKTTLGITANRDIHKGEAINFPIDLSIPCSALRQDVIEKLPKEYKRGVGNGKLPLIES